MDDKTEQLRDIFLDVAEEDAVTETQQEDRGSLVADEGSVDDRLVSVIERLREKFDLRTTLDDDALSELVRAFYAGDDDGDIADQLGCTREAVFRARMDLHLVREADLPGEELAAAIRDAGGVALEPDEWSEGELAAEFGVGAEAVERGREAMAAVDRSRRVSQRFRTAFEEVLTDADLSVQFTADTHEDGLEEATEDAEVDVQL